MYRISFNFLNSSVGHNIFGANHDGIFIYHLKFDIYSSLIKIYIKVLSGHNWELIWYCQKILISSIIKISNRNEHSSPHMIGRLSQLIVKTSKVRDLQVFSKLVESTFLLQKMNKLRLLQQNLYDFKNFTIVIYYY